MKQEKREKTKSDLLSAPREDIRLAKPVGRRARGGIAFVACCALLVAAFAVTGVWLGISDPEAQGSLSRIVGEIRQKGETSSTPARQVPDGEGNPSPDTESAEEPAAPEIPEDAVPVVAMDLSGTRNGTILNNETPYAPDLADLLSRDRAWLTDWNASEGPVVLVVHTHASEAYLPEETDWIAGPLGNSTYSSDPAHNVIAAGAALCRRLNEKGIPALQCAEMPEEATVRGAYERSAACVKELLTRYPSVRLVIDLHRDGILTEDGSYVRTKAPDGEACAQVMAVIGTDCNGTPCPAWEENLALALCLREKLNEDGADRSRPVFLRCASFNQELAPHSLLLEIGSGANTVRQAKRAAEATADALAQLMTGT